MRTGSNYFLSFIRIQNFNIHHRLHLEQNSFPALLLDHLCNSSVPSTAKGTFASIQPNAFVIFYHQKLPAQLTQKKTSRLFS
jgi:hypothetical protein